MKPGYKIIIKFIKNLNLNQKQLIKTKFNKINYSNELTLVHRVKNIKKLLTNSNSNNINNK